MNIEHIWPGWKIEEEIGRGADGRVYRAVRTDGGEKRYAAVKVVSISSRSPLVALLRSEGRDEHEAILEAANEVVQEIKFMMTLKDNPTVVRVEHCMGEHREDGSGYIIYILMELLTSLSDWIRTRKLTEKDVIRLGCDICTALEACGRKGIIHQDIKPENIFVELNSSGEVNRFKLGDFGAARKVEGGISQDGTVEYMAPEVYNGEPNCDARVDIYSLGIVLYCLLNENRLPFLDAERQYDARAWKEAAEYRLKAGKRLPNPCQASPAMADVICRACAYAKEDRWTSAEKMNLVLKSV